MQESIENKIIMKLIEIEQYMKEELIPRKEAYHLHDEVMTNVDQISTSNNRLDQELVMVQAKGNRLEARIEILEQKAGAV